MSARGLSAMGLCTLGLGAWIVAARAQGPATPPQPLPMTPLFRALDADGDGEISALEIDGAAAAVRTLDADKNGRVSRAEALGDFGRRPSTDPAAVVARLLAMDKDKDGKLGLGELPERMKALMDRADADKDGFLDKDELTVYARRQQRPAAPKPAPGGDPPR